MIAIVPEPSSFSRTIGTRLACIRLLPLSFSITSICQRCFVRNLDFNFYPCPSSPVRSASKPSVGESYKGLQRIRHTTGMLTTFGGRTG